MKYLIVLLLFWLSFAGMEYRTIEREADEIDSLNVQITSLQHDADACRAELNAEMTKAH
jgi:hypothetical protein